MKIPNKLSVALAAVILFTGCNLATPAEELISPPKLTGEQSEIYRALINSKGGGLNLKYPKSGEYRSAFVYWEDFPDAGERPLRDEEMGPPRVMVFYEVSGISTEPTLWLTFLQKRDGRWSCVYDMPFFATDIEKVEFSVLGDRGDANAIVSYSVLNQPEKGVSVINFTNEGMPERLIDRQYCVYYEVNSFLDEGEKNLFIITQDRAARESRASLIGWREGAFRFLNSVELNPDASEFVKITEGYIGDFAHDKTPALFLEYVKSDNSCNTGIVYKRGGKMKSVVYADDEQKREENLALLEKIPNAFTCHAVSRDIDGDGFTEAAGNVDFPGYDPAVNALNRVRAAIWYKIGGFTDLEKLYYSYLSANNDYVFIFPGRWEDKVTVAVSADSREVTFWAYHLPEYESVYDAQYRLLSITAVVKAESVAFLETAEDGWFLYDDESNGAYDYYVKRFDQTALVLTDDELENGFVIFTEQ
ncbi:MAG: hypothetical protein LBI36_07565 [Oscillospiraceae bacterium]|jgi:hypothetical protein|nr:hypothetical protein [Oscillospiraceae bacterium]